jgi:hypothetical protein
MFNLNPDHAGKEGGGIYTWIRIEDSNLDTFFTDLKKRSLSIVPEIGDRPWGERSFTVKDLNPSHRRQAAAWDTGDGHCPDGFYPPFISRCKDTSTG